MRFAEQVRESLGGRTEAALTEPSGSVLPVIRDALLALYSKG